MADAGLRVEGLTVRAGERILVHEVQLSLESGQIVGLVGASGAGKSLIARALVGLVSQELSVQTTMDVWADGARHTPYTAASPDFSGLWGRVLGYLPQDAAGSLDPFRFVRTQVQRAARRANGPHDDGACVAHLCTAGFDLQGARDVLHSYPHELSGGMAQRVALALVLARGGRLLIADEPTTGLDAPVQRALVAQLAQLAHRGMGILVVSHDLRWLGDVATELHVIEEGRVVEVLAPGASPSSQAARRLHDAAEGLRAPGFP